MFVAYRPMCKLSLGLCICVHDGNGNPRHILRSGAQCRGSSWAWWSHLQRHKKRVPCRSLTCQHHQMGIRLTRTNAPASKKRSSVAQCMARGRIQSARLSRILLLLTHAFGWVPLAMSVALVFFFNLGAMFVHVGTTCTSIESVFMLVFAARENNGGECHVRS